MAMSWLRDSFHVVFPGKKLLDDGGHEAELIILAKKMALTAVEADANLATQVQSTITLYAEAANLLQKPTLRESAAVGHKDGGKALAQTYLERTQVLRHVLTLLAEPPDKPAMTSAEMEATTFLQLRNAKANLGLRQPVGARPSDGPGGLCQPHCCDDDDDCTAFASKPASGGKSAQTWEPSGPSDVRLLAPPTRNSHGIERNNELMKTLFQLHDLNGNGVLEEEELVQLNKKIAMLHYGKDTDKAAVKSKFQLLFREKLSPEGQPASYESFRRYMAEVLSAMDPSLEAQEMIMEQFIAEAVQARAVFHCTSFASVSDAPFLSKLENMSGESCGAASASTREVISALDNQFH